MAEDERAKKCQMKVEEDREGQRRAADDTQHSQRTTPPKPSHRAPDKGTTSVLNLQTGNT